MIRRLLIGLGVLVVLALFAFYEILWAPNSFDGDRFIHVSKGENFPQVIDSLENAGIIRSRLLFDIAGRILESTTKMQIGKYRFKSGMSNHEILEDIRWGRTAEAIAIAIPEGLRATRQARLLARRLGIDSTRFVALVHDSGFARSLGVADTSLMGYLMPNTYKFYWQADEADIIRELVGEFWKIFNDTLRARCVQQGLSMREVLTMASIIEVESSIDSERSVIAGVYYNRLKKGMPLQADPTIEYILDDGPRRLHFSDLSLESAYNTYLHRGLPPGPINNPGRASIVAALYPAKHKYLYFVARGGGGHTFSKTFNEHVRAARRYRKMLEEQQAAKEEAGG